MPEYQSFLDIPYIILYKLTKNLKIALRFTFSSLYCISIATKNLTEKSESLDTIGSHSLKKLAPHVGLEPTTYRLTAERSTN